MARGNSISCVSVWWSNLNNPGVVSLSPAATTIVEAGKDKQNPDDFAEALDSVLGDFAFPDVFLFDVWGALGDVKNGRF